MNGLRWIGLVAKGAATALARRSGKALLVFLELQVFDREPLWRLPRRALDSWRATG